MTDLKRDYYRELVLCTLHRAHTPCTTDELVELMGITVQSESHPRALWNGINPGSVAGYLRSLEKAGAVVKEDHCRRDSRHGRDTPVWTIKDDRDPKYPVPNPYALSDPIPVERAPAAAPEPESQYQNHDRKQLLALLDHSDEVMGAVARFMTDLRDINRRHRQRFIDLGIATE